MRAVSYDSFAPDNSRLKVGELPDPKVGPGQVLIEVRAAGVNPVDWKVMAGRLDGMMDAMFPVIPGWDVAGVVRGLGPDTPEFSPGDEVDVVRPQGRRRRGHVRGVRRRGRRTAWRANPPSSTGTRRPACRSRG